MKDVCDRAQEQNRDVIYNLTGGKKLMTLGGLLGSLDRGVQFVAVAGAPLRTEAIMGLDQAEMARNGELSLDSYLGLYGAREPDRDRRLRKQAFYSTHAKKIRAFADIIAGGGIATTTFLE